MRQREGTVGMDQKKLTRGCLLAVGIVAILLVGLYFIGGSSFWRRVSQTDMLSPTGGTWPMGGGEAVEQRIRPEGDRLTGVVLRCAQSGPESSTVELAILADNVPVDSRTAQVAPGVGETFFVPFSLELTEAPQDSALVLRITARAPEGSGLILYYGSSVQLGRGAVATALTPEDMARVNGEAVDGMLCMELTTETDLWLGQHYWAVAGLILCLVAGVCAWLWYANREGRPSALLKLFMSLSRYRFLMKQLVARDFKTKYKRSVLGVLWSFLNPLLTMTVQYIIFSTLFRSNIPNFALYLLIGIVCFSFFNEAATMTLGSIVGNAHLITKVYVPKYVYPLTRVFSSTINFLLALIPILAVMLLTGAPFSWAMLLLPLPILCLFALSLGVGMGLAASMVFFRDTQFLWGVISMLWMYCTPIFYPETIFPERFLIIFKCNPLYHIIRFCRIILMNGVSPEPKAYLLMIAASLLPLCLGVWVFRKTQDRFIFNL